MSAWVTAKRITRYGLIGFFRNGFVSLAAILIMTITLFVMGALIVGSAALNATLEQLTEKVDVNVYFYTDAPEQGMLDLKQQLEALPEVAVVTYVSRDEALTRFRERHKNDQLTIQALDELEDNPLGASLAVRAKETHQYESISKFLEGSAAASGEGDARIIDKVNFSQNKTAIDRLSEIIKTSQNLGTTVAVILALASILIAFNTIRLAIYTSRDEIAVMRLVGAGPWYVRGPFVVSGILYGIASGLFVLMVLYPLAAWLAEPSEQFFGNFNTLTYVTDNIFMIVGAIIGTGILLGAVSSYGAVHRYLRN